MLGQHQRIVITLTHMVVNTTIDRLNLYLESEDHFTLFCLKKCGLAKKTTLLIKAQRCDNSEWLIHLICDNKYESYSSVPITLHTKANVFERKENG